MKSMAEILRHDEGVRKRIKHLEQGFYEPEAFRVDVKPLADLMYKAFPKGLFTTHRPRYHWRQLEAWRIAPMHIPLFVIAPSWMLTHERIKFIDKSPFYFTLKDTGPVKPRYTYIECSFASVLVQGGCVQHGLVSRYDKPSHIREDFGLPIAAIDLKGNMIDAVSQYQPVDFAVMTIDRFRLSNTSYPHTEFGGFVVMSAKTFGVDNKIRTATSISWTDVEESDGDGA